MSGTRLHFPKAPATKDRPREALIVAHGQPSRPGPPETAMARLAVSVQEQMPGWRIRSATMAAPGALEAALEGLPDCALIYPMFMAKGWFVGKALTARLGDRTMRVTDPLGLDPRLPSLAAQAIMAETMRRNWPIESVRIVLAAHGSGRSDHASVAAREFADNLSDLLSCRDIRVGFVEQSPSISDAAQGTDHMSLCLPFFACDGDHMQKDVPQALAAGAFKGRLMPVIGQHPLVPMLIADALRSQQSQDHAA